MIKYKIESENVHLQAFASTKDSEMGILFLHGGPGSGAWPLIMQSAIQRLCKEFRCIFFDQRGCGLTLCNLETGISYKECMNDITAIVKDIKKRFACKKLILCGDGFGGYQAILASNLLNECIDGLILMRPLFLINKDASEKFFNLIKRKCMENGNTQLNKTFNILNELNAMAFFHNQHIRQWVFSHMNSSTALRHITAMADWMFSMPTESIIQSTIIPTLILQGNEDMIEKEGNIIDTLVRLKNPFLVYESFPSFHQVGNEDVSIEFVSRMERFLHDEFPDVK